MSHLFSKVRLNHKPEDEKIAGLGFFLYYPHSQCSAVIAQRLSRTKSREFPNHSKSVLVREPFW